jgi:hypothetical protein
LRKSRPPSPSEMQPASRFHIRTQHTQPTVLFALTTRRALHNQYSARHQQKYIYAFVRFWALPPEYMTKYVLDALTFLILCFDNVIIF